MNTIPVKIGTKSEIIAHMQSLSKLTAQSIVDPQINTLSPGDLFEVAHRTINKQIDDAIGSGLKYVQIALNRFPVGSGHHLEQFIISYESDLTHGMNWNAFGDSVASEPETVTTSADLTYWK